MCEKSSDSPTVIAPAVLSLANILLCILSEYRFFYKDIYEVPVLKTISPVGQIKKKFI